MIVNSSQGGGSKDTWVVRSEKTHPAEDQPAAPNITARPNLESERA